MSHLRLLSGHTTSNPESAHDLTGTTIHGWLPVRPANMYTNVQKIVREGVYGFACRSKYIRTLKHNFRVADGTGVDGDTPRLSVLIRRITLQIALDEC